MNKLLATILTLGFLFVDFLFFHDAFKPGEDVTIPQYLTGVLSTLVFILSMQVFVRDVQRSKHSH
jgi:hypothetical protein